MADETVDGTMLSMLARLNVLEQFVRLMFRSMNSEGQVSANDLMKMADRYVCSMILQCGTSSRRPIKPQPWTPSSMRWFPI